MLVCRMASASELVASLSDRRRELEKLGIVFFVDARQLCDNSGKLSSALNKLIDIGIVCPAASSASESTSRAACASVFLPTWSRCSESASASASLNDGHTVPALRVCAAKRLHKRNGNQHSHSRHATRSECRILWRRRATLARMRPRCRAWPPCAPRHRPLHWLAAARRAGRAR